MKYFSDINERLHKNDLDWYVSQINEDIMINEFSLKQLFKNLLMKKSSLARSLFKLGDEETNKTIKDAINNDKLKAINDQKKWWDNFFKDQYESLHERWTDINGKDDPKKYFTKDKFEEYNKEDDGMNKAVIAGLCVMHDIANSEGGNEAKATATRIKGIMDDMLKTKDLKDKDFLEEILKNYDIELKKKDNEKEKTAEEKPANDGKPTGDAEKNLGTDNQDAVVSPEQLKTGVQQEIKDDTDFLKPLVKTAGIDGEALSNYVTGIIKDAFKEEVKDPDTGVSNYEWKKGAVAAIAASKDGEKRIVNGISAMVCGALILKSENIIDAVYNIKALDPKGVAKKLEKLKNQMTKVDADPNAGE